MQRLRHHFLARLGTAHGGRARFLRCDVAGDRSHAVEAVQHRASGEAGPGASPGAAPGALRIGVQTETYNGAPTHPECRDAALSAANPRLIYVGHDFGAMYGALAAGVEAEDVAEHAARMHPDERRRLVELADQAEIHHGDALALEHCPADRRHYHAALYDALAGALLLLPFAASTVRFMRRKKA